MNGRPSSGIRGALAPLSLVLGSSLSADRLRTFAALLLYPLAFLESPFIGFILKLATDGAVAGSAARLGLAAGALVTVLCLFYMVDQGAWQICLDLEDRIGIVIDGRIMNALNSAKGLEIFERPEALDRLEALRERGWMLSRAMYLLPMNFADLVRASATFILLASVHPLLLLLPLFAIPSLLLDSSSEERVRGAEEAGLGGLRRARHLYDLCLSPAAGKELRVFGLRGEIFKRHRAEWMGLHLRTMGIRTGSAGRIVLGRLCFAAGFAAALGFIAWRVSTGASSPGQLVLVLALASQVSMETRATFEMIDWTRWIGRIAGHLLWLEETARGASAVPSNGPVTPPDRLADGIVFDGVSFRYPGSDAWVLNDVSFRLPAGHSMAIVGENGAGKTTLVKLLCRFYEPTRGRILVEGQDLRAMDVEEWRSRISASFQDFHRFQLTAAESVGIGDLPRLDDETAVLAALERADASEIPGRLPRGLRTRLGASWDNGAELSIGQWQKVALARCLMRTAPVLLILDEPTAALDPQTEHSVFERQARAAAAGTAECSRGAITLIVSHRFSTVAMADRILVVDGGRIAEQGTHRELIAAKGLYARLYGIQAAAYKM